MAEVTLDLDAKQWQRFLDSLGRKMGRATDMLLELGKIHGFQDIIKHFNDEKGPDGSWAPWSPAYAEKRRRAAEGGSRLRRQRRSGGPVTAKGKILQDTGNLRNSLLPSGTSVGEGDIRKKGRGIVELFTTVPYASVHEYGTSRVPQRSFMWLSDDAVDKVAEGLIQWAIEED